MERYYEKSDKKNFTREAIIGLGEESFRKNYYPELQDKISDLEQMYARNRALLSTIPDILLVSNQKGQIIPFSTPSSKDQTMIDEILNSEEYIRILESGVKEVLDHDILYTNEFSITKNYNTIYYEARFRKSEYNEVLIILRDMTERIQLEKQLRKLVDRDSLTGLYNRRCFEQQLVQLTGQNLNNITMISIDINGLKFINDTLGHLIGDSIIMKAGYYIDQIFGELGLVARIGGDEFGVILHGVEETIIKEQLNALNDLVEQHNRDSLTSTLSLAYGYSFHKEGLVNMELLYQEADNIMYQSKLLKKDSIRGTFVSTFMKALEVKDYISEGHVARMERLAVAIGDALSLRQKQMDRIALLTKFHDIGKIGIPDSILNKSGKLTPDEWKVMQTHSIIGERIAIESAEIREIAPLILKHHEYYDGNGYPLGLKGTDIPIECRVLAIVDAFDTMTNDRPYRSARAAKDAIEEIKHCGGTQFDPELVSVFCRIQASLSPTQ
ncbi:MAG: Diguanylate cyclase [Firmicutes bacterium]|nr:Diguanylate cyclase [Bacillota bacterium]